MSLPKYITATKEVTYDVSFVIENMANDERFDMENITVENVLEFLETEMEFDFGYEEPFPTITYEY